MRNRKLQKELRREADAHTPHIGDAIATQAEREGLLRDSTPVKQKRGLRRTLTSLAAAACCLALLVPFGSYLLTPNAPAEDVTTICMQINPAVEFTVADGVVSNVRALNTDASVLLVGNDLVGKTAEEACEEFASLAEAQNLITENGITLYVSGKDEGAIEDKITNRLAAHNYSWRRGAEEYKERAEKFAKKYDISGGKARMIAELLAKFPKLKEKDLVKMDNADLHELIEDYQETEMKAFEQELHSKYMKKHADFITEVTALMTLYLADLDALAIETETALSERIAAFNEKYAKLGEDFLLDPDTTAEELAEELAERKEELAELAVDLAKNADKIFREIFENWREDFHKDTFKDKHPHHDDEDDKDDEDDDWHFWKDFDHDNKPEDKPVPGEGSGEGMHDDSHDPQHS